MFLPETRDLRRFRVLIRLRPVRPHPDVRIPPVQILIERAIGGEPLQQIAFAKAKGLEFKLIHPASQKFQKRQLQKTKLPRLYRLVFHGFRVPQRPQLLLRLGAVPQALRAFRILKVFDRLNIQVNAVLVKNGIRQIWTGIKRTPVVNRVQWIEADKNAARFSGRPIGKIA